MKTKKRSVLDFDELNSYDMYYAPMQIDIGSKARRRELAEYLTDAFIFFFSVFDVHRHYNGLLEKQLYQQLLADRISEAVAKVTGIDSYMSNHIRQMSKEVVDTTFKNVKPKDDEVKPEPASRKKIPHSQSQSLNSNNNQKAPITPTTPASLIPNSAKESLVPPYTNTNGSSSRQDESDIDDIYWLSYKRAEDIAKSEANTFLNYTDFVEAKEQGFTHKRWLTMLDDKVRQTHAEVEGQTIEIDEVFDVGNSQMRFPHDLDSAPDPQEVIGCRCAVEYL